MSSQFTNNKNKELLWNLLLNNGAFNNLTEQQLPIIQNDFQNLILSLYNENSNLNLIEQNKLFVQQMVQKINSQKQQMKIYEPVKEIYTSQDIRNKKLDEFNSNVEKAQNEFNSVITLKTPEEINFSDSKDLDKPISNMDELIEKTIAERNLDVNNINIKGDSKDNVEKWLNLQEEKPKQVSFNETNNQVIEPSSNSVDDNKFLTLLTEIKSNQLEILELLRNK
tara:strand:+ start:278 stop:949 length:672 start_codon:yes stop_codon:yes gene_type:complete